MPEIPAGTTKQNGQRSARLKSVSHLRGNDDQGWTKRKLKGFIHVKHGYPFKSEYFADSGELVVLTPGNFWEAGGFKEQAGKEKFYV
jgi:hypothetical protein